MSSNKDTTVAAAEYWGYLIKPDKNPSPLFEQLLLGVAHYIVSSIKSIHAMALESSSAN